MLFGFIVLSSIVVWAFSVSTNGVFVHFFLLLSPLPTVQTGRMRLVRGEGEIIEGIVSKAEQVVAQLQFFVWCCLCVAFLVTLAGKLSISLLVFPVKFLLRFFSLSLSSRSCILCFLAFVPLLLCLLSLTSAGWGGPEFFWRLCLSPLLAGLD